MSKEGVDNIDYLIKSIKIIIKNLSSYEDEIVSYFLAMKKFIKIKTN